MAKTTIVLIYIIKELVLLENVNHVLKIEHLKVKKIYYLSFKFVSLANG
jgi:hypothetical protein